MPGPFWPSFSLKAGMQFADIMQKGKNSKAGNYYRRKRTASNTLQPGAESGQGCDAFKTSRYIGTVMCKMVEISGEAVGFCPWEVIELGFFRLRHFAQQAPRHFQW
jgi:hypothetical protein